jgi:glycosyltransferase involved in cell wall biosynthesis
MHIAFWSPAWPLEQFQNGIITYVHWMKLELERRGHTVTIFTSGAAQPNDQSNIRRVRRSKWSDRLHRLVMNRLSLGYEMFNFSSVIAADVLRVHRRNPIDIIEIEESFGWCADLGSRTSIPVVVRLHGPAFLSMVESELNTPFGRKKILREGRALKKAHAVVSPSALTLEQTTAKYNLEPGHSRWIVNPIAMDAHTPVWKLQHCEPETLLFVGRFDLRKGADIVLAAFQSLLPDRPNLKLLFVGPDRGLACADGTHLHFSEYLNSTFPDSLRDRVEFLGPLDANEISKLRTRAMVTIIASRWENQSYALLEAMYQGCPVVCTDAGGCPESITDGVNGKLAKSESPEHFAQQLQAILDDPIAAEALGQAARRHVLEFHSMQRVAGDALKMYGDVIGNSREETVTA